MIFIYSQSVTINILIIIIYVFVIYILELLHGYMLQDKRHKSLKRYLKYEEIIFRLPLLRFPPSLSKPS